MTIQQELDERMQELNEKFCIGAIGEIEYQILKNLYELQANMKGIEFEHEYSY